MNEKLFLAMSAEERQTWLSEYQTWVSEQLPEIEAATPNFSKEHIEMIEKGMTLLSAFSFCRVAIREARLYKDYSRRVRTFRRLADKVTVEVSKYSASTIDLSDPSLLRTHVGRPTRAERQARKLQQEKERKAKENEESLFGKTEDIPTDNTVTESSLSGSMGATLHLDQLMFLMDETLQAEVGTIRDLRAAAAEAATIAKTMAEEGKSEEETAEYAQQAATATEQYEAIYAKVDKAMAKAYVRCKEDSTYIEQLTAQGRNADEIRTALRPYWDKIEDKDAFKADVIAETKANDPEQAAAREEKEEKDAKVRLLIRYITRKDKENTPKRIEGLEKKIKELEELVGEEEAKPYYAILEEAKANPAPARKDKSDDKK